MRFRHTRVRQALKPPCRAARVLRTWMLTAMIFLARVAVPRHMSGGVSQNVN